MELDFLEKMLFPQMQTTHRPTFTLFENLSVQKDTLFKKLNSEIVYPL